MEKDNRINPIEIVEKLKKIYGVDVVIKVLVSDNFVGNGDEMKKAVWLEARKRSIGGTDISALMGVSPYKTAFDVWLDKTGASQPLQQNHPMEWGLRLEKTIAEKYAENLDVELIDGADLFKRHENYNFLHATPDFLIRGKKRGLEIKTASAYSANNWDFEIPKHYELQARFYMAIFDLPVWDFAVLIGGQDYRDPTTHKFLRVRRDYEIENNFINKAREWYDLYIEMGLKPAPDSSKAYREHQAELQKIKEKTDRKAKQKEIVLMKKIELSKIIQKEQKEKQKENENLLRESMGDVWKITSARFTATQSEKRTTVKRVKK